MSNGLKMVDVGINGFGRFGLHLLKYWLDRTTSSNFRIAYINDDSLDIRKAFSILINDKYVIFNKYKCQISDDYLTILEPNGRKHEISFTNQKSTKIPWLGKPEIVFECSGKYTVAKNCSHYLKGITKKVLISATSWDVDKTLVFGFNHEEYKADYDTISYGSCTVNAYLPFANWINKNYGIINSDVNVVHNIQEYRLSDNNTLIRKFCTLEKSAVQLLDCINEDNFIVNYTVIPYTGVSMIDFRFRVGNNPDRNELLTNLESAVTDGVLRDLYGLDEVDIGPEVYNCTRFSTVFIKEGIKCIGDNIYFQGYFDNENSVNRFFDLANYISSQ